jgi:hypothetical protein
MDRRMPTRLEGCLESKGRTSFLEKRSKKLLLVAGICPAGAKTPGKSVFRILVSEMTQ